MERANGTRIVLAKNGASATKDNCVKSFPINEPRRIEMVEVAHTCGGFNIVTPWTIPFQATDLAAVPTEITLDAEDGD